MRFSRFFKRSLRITKFHPDADRDVSDEIQFHIDMRIQELIEEGRDPVDAEREILAAFGDRGRVEAECRHWTGQIGRDSRRKQIAESFFADLKIAFRDMRKNPSHYIAVSLTLVPALALATAVFSVVYAVILKPLPFGEPDRVVTVFNHPTKSEFRRIANSAKDYLHRRESIDAFDDVCLYTSQTRSIGEPGAISREFSMHVTPSFFRVLGLQPRLGRFLDEDQIQPGRSPQAVISTQLWRQYFASDPEIVGRSVDVEGEAHTIVGVMPEGFSFPGWDASLWLPLPIDESLPIEALYASSFSMLARLQSGATVEQAKAELEALNRRVSEQLPVQIQTQRAQNGYRTEAVNFHHDLTREVRGWLFLLLAGSVFVLLIACFSISNLQWVHTSGRLQELSTRFMLGAGRARLVRQLLTESLAPALVGGSLGIAVGTWSLRWWLTRFQTWEIPRIDEVGLGAVEVTVLGTVALLAMVVAGFFGAFSVSGSNLFSLTRQGSSSATQNQSKWRGALLAAQIAMAVVLLVGATLMVVSLRNLLAIDLGFEKEGVRAAAISLSPDRYDTAAARASFFESLLEEVAALPGVESAAVASRIPFSGWDESTSLTVQGRARPHGEAAEPHHRTMVSTDFFEVLGIQLRAGRVFNKADDRDATPVIVVSEHLANRYWPGESAIGKEVTLGPIADSDSVWMTVVGVVEEIVQEELTEAPLGAYYLPFQQAPRGFVRLVVKPKSSPQTGYVGGSLAEIRQKVAAANPELALFWVTTLEETVDSSLIAYRLPMQFLSIFAIIALLLAAVGVFGVLSRNVTLRSREIGIRLALGSSRRQICSSMLTGLGGFIAAGLLAGVIGAVFLSRWVESLVFGIRPTEPWIFLAVAGIIAVISLLAAFVPTLRAGRVDPVRALAVQ